MVGKNTLLSYDFTNIEEYYQYIIASEINGQFKQVKNLIKNLSTKQVREFINLLINENNHNFVIKYL